MPPSIREKVVPKNKSLFPYQKEGVLEIVKSKRRRHLLADVPGLGKTIQAIVCSNIWQCSKVLILAPACLIYNWKREWQDWDTLNRSVFVVEGKRNFKKYKGEDVIICSYASSEALLDIPGPYTLITDEFHYCSNWGSARTKRVIFEILPKADKFIAITGTPLTKDITGLHPIVSSIAPNLFGKFHSFCERYSTPVFDGFQIQYRGVRRVKELREKLRNFMIRRYKEDVLPDLPEKLYARVDIGINKKIAEKSLEYRSYVDALLNEDSSKELPMLSKVRKELAEQKIPSIISFVEEMCTGGDTPIVVFSYHRKVTKELYEGLKNKGIKAEKIIGGDSAKHKEEVVSSFQAGKLDVVVLSIKAAGVGITLTKSCRVVFSEILGVPADMSQAIDRCHRIGQDRGVRVYFCIAKDSIEERIYTTLLSRIKLVSKVMGKDGEGTRDN